MVRKAKRASDASVFLIAGGLAAAGVVVIGAAYALTQGDREEPSVPIKQLANQPMEPSGPSAEEIRQAELARRLALEEEARKQQEQARKRREDTAYSIAASSHRRVINEAYECGNNVAYDLDDWEYVEQRDMYKLELTLTWAGCFTGDPYEATGTLRQENGAISWHPDWHNQNLDQYIERKNFAKIAVGTAIVIGAAAAEANKE